MKYISLTSNKLKLIAVAAMVFDHFVGGFLVTDNIFGIILKTPGRIAAPIMCFLIAEGYFHTHNLNKYLLRLFVFALISHLPYNLYFSLGFFEATSVMWSLFLGLLALSVIKQEKLNIIIKTLAVIVCCVLSVRANWNYLAVLWIVFFGIFRGDYKKQMISLVLVGLLQIIPVYLGVGPVIESGPHFFRLGIYLSIPLLYFYKGERGKNSKWISRFFYWFYPLHLIVFYLIRLCLA